MFDSVLSCGLSGLFERYPAGSLDVKLSERSLRMILLCIRALFPAGVVSECWLFPCDFVSVEMSILGSFNLISILQ
jgi:hypothetical protein